ncbi:MAG TPA: hypothetical protein VK054_00925 [Beutenbergiaceae bacterium]|nr:hypothetical protein [Beutenbergiaceae bacterium]
MNDSQAKLERKQANRDRRAARRQEAKFVARIGGHAVIRENYVNGLKKVPIAGATAEYESGATEKRITGTRVITGAVLFGPLGAVAGGVLRKDKSKCYVTITFPDGNVVIVDAPLKEEKKAREFAATVNAAGAYYADRD